MSNFEVLIFGFCSGSISVSMNFDTSVDEVVKVWAFFDPSALPSSIFPIAMNWRRRLIKFEKLIFANKRRVGDTSLISLVCAGENSNYELEYNLTTSTWKLKRVMG